MNIRFLETFIWVARLHSFKAAAGKLNLTQAAISGRIAALENELGRQLFERGQRDIPLTPAGRTLLSYAEKMVETEHAMHSALQGPPTLRGIVRLGIVESIVHTWFKSFLRRLYATHPDLDIELTAESTRRLHDLVKRGGVDVALQTDPVVGDGVRNRDLGTMAMGWICATEAPIPECATLAELARHPMVTFPRHSQPHLELLHILEQAAVRPGRIHFVSSIAASTRFIEAGLGVATLPISAVRQGLDEGRYRLIRCEHSLPDLRLVASWQPDPVTGLHEAVVALALDEMRRYAANTPDARPPLDSTVLTL